MSKKSLKAPTVNLTLAEQVELGRRMTELGDDSARDTLILNCVPIVITAAKGFSKHNQASYDDLFQEGMMGVVEAIDKYDYTRNVKFSSFAYTRIIHKLALWVRKQSGYRPAQRAGKKVNGALLDSTIETFQSVFNTYPTDTQLAKLLSISPEDVVYVKKHYGNPVPPSVRARTCRGFMYEAKSIEPDISDFVEKKLCTKYNRDHIVAALQTMGEVEQSIVIGRYLYEDKKKTLQELADTFGMSPATICRRERDALNAVLRYFEDNEIQPEL